MAEAERTPTGLIAILRAVGYLSSLDVHFAQTLSRVAGRQEPLVSLAAALVSRHVGAGHVCLDLSALCATGSPQLALDATADRVVDGDTLGAAQREATEPEALRWPPLSTWLAALRSSPLVGAADAVTPLVLAASGARVRLYLRRYFEHEQALSRDIQARVALPPEPPPPRDALDRLFPPSTLADKKGAALAQLSLDVAPVDRQRLAAERAVQRRLCVITGGPGTGKTATVARILALHVERTLAAGQPPPRVQLLAPTGKAAARLSESIAAARESLACDANVRAAIPDTATTIHRALGARPDQTVGFAHDAEHPMATDLVLVDEASMVDLALMRRLLAAIPRAARVILLGDRDQLASVEAGAVLGDVCGAGLSPEARAAVPLAGCQVHLTRSYRYDEHSGIGRLADAIRRKDAPAALKLLQNRRNADVSLVAPPPEAGESQWQARNREDTWLSALVRDAAEAYRGLAGVSDPEQGFSLLSGFRVLCANRRGPRGVERINGAIAEALACTTRGEPARGTPIIVEHNDYQLRVFNGDVGLLLPDAGGQLRAFFPLAGGYQRVSPKRLPAHSSVYAMSIHKSQGSEMDRVAIVLPRLGSPLLTRELLYTAVTRARRRVTIYGTPEAVVTAIETDLRRESGLRERLWRVSG